MTTEYLQNTRYSVYIKDQGPLFEKIADEAFARFLPQANDDDKGAILNKAAYSIKENNRRLRYKAQDSKRKIPENTSEYRRDKFGDWKRDCVLNDDMLNSIPDSVIEKDLERRGLFYQLSV